jgi:GH24 family phage-related lysozyme (muramidase)
MSDIKTGASFGAELLKQYEGYLQKASYDVNAWRIGHGSDTITDNNGKFRKVVQGDITTRANAQKDLTRRMVEFEKKVAKKVGPEFWEPLDYKVKGALISLAYNYGNITKQGIIDAIKTGNSVKIANAVVNTTINDNKKLSPGIQNALKVRRKKESDIIRASPNAKTSQEKSKLLPVLILAGAVTLIFFGLKQK